MDTSFENWDDFLAAYDDKTPEEKEEARARLSVEQLQYLKTALDPDGSIPLPRYKDFEPQQTKRAGFLTAAEYEALNRAMDRAHFWILENNVDIINVETVVLPNIHKAYEEGTEDGSLFTSGPDGSRWHQFIRVWYRNR